MAKTKDPLAEAEAALRSATGKYRAKYLAGFELPDTVRRAAEAQSPEIKLTRSGLEAKYTDPKYSDPNSDTFIPPETRAALVRQEQQGARGYLSRVTDSASRLYDRDVQASRFGVEDAQATYGGYAEEAARQRKRREDLEDYMAKEQISSRFRVGKAPPYSTFADARKDPLGFFLASGGGRKPDSRGGYAFFDQQGNPITVEEAAGMVPGASRADFLADSSNPQDMPQKVDPNSGFQADLDAAVSAIRTGAKKKDVRARLLGSYPTYGAAIDSALGFK